MSSQLNPVNTAITSRSLAWGFLSAAMEYPEGELTELIRAGDVERRARELFIEIYSELADKINWAALREAGEADFLSIEYTRLFDVGGSDGPPCALNSGAAKGDSRMGLLEELVRFYNYFGLTAAGTEANELPDHLSSQFEFMHYLIHQQGECVETGAAADDYIRAQRDFLNRHPSSWVPLLAANLVKHKAAPYYLTLGQLMDEFVQLEQRHLELAVAALPPPEPHVEPAELDQPIKTGSMSSVITVHRKAKDLGEDDLDE